MKTYDAIHALLVFQQDLVARNKEIVKLSKLARNEETPCELIALADELIANHKEFTQAGDSITKLRATMKKRAHIDFH